VLPVVVGKKGAKVQLLRQKYPDATIDVDWALACVRIHAESEELRQAVREELEQIAEQNYSVEIVIDQEIAIMLKSGRTGIVRRCASSVICDGLLLVLSYFRGAETRKQLTAMQVHMDIDNDAEVVRLRGNRSAVDDAANLIQAFISTNHTLEMAVDGD